MRLYRSKSADPGILPLVHALQRAGFRTSYSCQGGKGHQFKHPTIDVLAPEGETAQTRVKLGQWGAQHRASFHVIRYEYIARTPRGHLRKPKFWAWRLTFWVKRH